MKEVDPRTRAEAARRYATLRRWWWQSFLAMPVIWVVLTVSLVALGSWSSPVVRAALTGAGTAGFFGSWVIALVSWLRLLRFRCPRCGGRFLLSWWSSWPTSTCKHCGLDLGPSRGPDAKGPPGDPDF